MWLFWTLFCILFTFLVALESFGGPSSLPRQHTAIGVSKGLIGEEVSKTAGILLASVLRARSPVMLDYHAEDHGARQVLIAAVHVERQEGGPEDGSFSRRLLQSPVTPQESLAAAPPPPAPPPRVKVCYDTPYNFSADGRTCDKYIDDDEAQDDLRLPLRGCRFSKAAGEACCRCGGGVSLCEEERNWYDSQGIACQSYDKVRRDALHID